MSGPTKFSDSYRFLLLASYCGPENPECTEQLPCPDCLIMCNTVTVEGAEITENFGGYIYQRDQLKKSKP